MLTSQIENTFDAKIKTGMAMVARPTFDGEQSYYKPIPESKSIQEIPSLSDAKGHRSWNRKIKNTMEQVRVKSRSILALLEKSTDDELHNKYHTGGCTTQKEAIVMVMEEKHGQQHKDLERALEITNRDMWSILRAKSSG